MPNKNIFKLLIVFVGVISLTTGSNPDLTRTIKAETSQPLRVLFVGNSYTYVNDLPWLVEQMSLWARKNRPDTQKAITEAYTHIAREINSIVAPVGLAWERAVKETPELTLYHEDQSHPGPAGTYLAASVFYAIFYGKSPEGLTGRTFSTEFGKPAKANGSRRKASAKKTPDSFSVSPGKA
jgi:hypothetical protein